MSYKKLVSLFREFSEEHPEVNLFGAGFEDQREVKISEDRKRVSAWLTEPKTSGVIEANNLVVDLILSDLLLNGRQNEIDIISDLNLIMEDYKQKFLEGESDFQMVNFFYGVTQGNTDEDEEISVRASFTFNFVNLGTCNF